MRKDPLGLKLAAAFGFLVLILVGVGWWGLNRMSRINSEVNEILIRRWEKVRLARQAVFLANLNYRLSIDIFFLDHKDGNEIGDLMERRAANAERISGIVKQIQAEVDSDKERELLASIDQSWLPALESLQQSLNLLISQKKPEAARQMMLSVTHPLVDQYHDRWYAFAQYEEDQMGQAWDRSEADYSAARRISTLLVLIAIVAAVGIAAFVTRKMMREVEQREQIEIEIRRLNESLEKKVGERTEELAHAIHKLESEVGERERREQDLRRLAAIVESSDDAIIGASIEGIILSWNAAAERIYGYTAAEIIGQPGSVLVPSDSPNETSEILDHVKRGGNPQQFETAHIRKDGKQIPVALTASPIRDAAAHVVGISMIARNISERRRLEAMFRQAQKMEAVGRLAGGVAHDFNNLLSVIIGYSELLLDQSGEDSSLRNSSEQIKRAADRAAGLTRQLLAFSRQQMLEIRVLNLNAVVGEMSKMLPRLIGEDIELQLSLGKDLGAVRADPGQIEQVIMNLAVNARDAMPEGGKLLVQTANVAVDEDYAQSHPPMVPGEYVLLAITDTGVGMDAATQAHIFEPFFTTKQQGHGTGLGLATVYGFVKQSGGYIWVYSEPGLGTTFKVYLPRVLESVVACPISEPEGRLPRRTDTVLLVEDEQSLRGLTRTLLEQQGYTVLEAEDGSAALEQSRGYSGMINVLLTDMVMPGMSGQTVAEQLWLERPEVKVVYMSGYTGFAHREMLDPHQILLQKPFTRDALLRKLNEALELQRQPEPT